MLQPSTLKFLKGLKKNNNRPWFEAHRKQYEIAKEDFYVLVDALITGIAGFEKAIGALKAKDCTFRINRDVRFSKDKRPYKNNIAAYFNKEGKKSNLGGYYLHIEPGHSFVAGGLWMPEPAILAGIRQEIDYSYEEWKKITGNATFKKTFPKGVSSEAMLIRPPKGYEADNPAIEYLKMKSFVVSAPVSDAAIQSNNFVKEVVKIMQAIKPMVDFLNRVGE
jgi:uncharacterized protein (TIGR02453 family)